MQRQRQGPHPRVAFILEAAERQGVMLTRRSVEDVLLDELLEGQPWPHTLEEIGAMLGVTRERVRQIQVNAMRKLRRACVREGIHWSDFCKAAGMIDYTPGTYDAIRICRLNYQKRQRAAS